MVVWKNKMSSTRERGRGRAGKRVGRPKPAPKSTSAKDTKPRAAKRARGSARQPRGSRNTRGGIKPPAEPKIITTTTTTTTTTSANDHGESDSDIVYANDEKVVESNKTIVGNGCEIHGENLIVIGGGHTIYARNVKVHGDTNTIHSNSAEIHGVNNVILGYTSPAMRVDDNTYIEQTDNDSFFQHRVYPRGNRDMGSNLAAFNSVNRYSRNVTPPSIGQNRYGSSHEIASTSQLVHDHYLSMRAVDEQLLRGFSGNVPEIPVTTTTTTTTASNNSGAGKLPEFPIDVCASDDEYCDDNDMGARECSVCMENKIKAVVLPCAHACMCLSCASKIIANAAASDERGKCPICRKEIENIIKIYLK